MNERHVYIEENNLIIPANELSFSFSTSGGPGGQHANRAATRVTLSFDVANSPSLTEAQRETLLKRLASRLDQEGVLQLSARDSRSQHRNREMALERFEELLRRALKPRKRRRKTRPSAAANERRLQEKKRRGQRKKERSQDYRGANR